MGNFPGEPKASFAIVGDPIAAVIAAAPLRREGISVITYLSGNEKRQRKHAMKDAWQTLSVAEAEEHSTSLDRKTNA